VVERDHLDDRAAHRHAHQVCGPDAQGVEDADRVADQIASGVSGLAGRIAERPTRVAVVVADHESSAGGDPGTELLVPPVHRLCRAHDQQDGRVAALAEGLGTERDAVALRISSLRSSPTSPARRFGFHQSDS
jgi:hypothetical protein